jgi:predicted RND superfamily exporter protein
LKTTGFIEKLADFQTRRPFVILLLAAVVSVVSFFFARNLGLDSRFIALLPEDPPSVQDLDEVRERVRDHKHLYASLDILERLRDALQDRRS